MNLNGVEYGRVVTASGVQGFFGEGYWYHRWLAYMGFNFKGATHIAKTCTVEPRRGPKYPGEGNMPVKEDGITPRQLFPACIYVNTFRGVVVNAVGLVNPGIKALLEDGRWQQATRPWIMSFMAVGNSPAERLEETREFVRILLPYVKDFPIPFALERNVSCPNVGHDPGTLTDEIGEGNQILAELKLAQGVKLNLLVAPKTAVVIAQDKNCHFLGAYNTYPFDQIPPDINREELFGDVQVSPLIKRGFKEPGGASGIPFVGYSISWNIRVRELGMQKPLIGGLGIGSVGTAKGMETAIHLYGGEASAVALGSVVMVRPNQVRPIINSLQ